MAYLPESGWSVSFAKKLSPVHVAAALAVVVGGGVGTAGVLSLCRLLHCLVHAPIVPDFAVVGMTGGVVSLAPVPVPVALPAAAPDWF